MQRDRLVAVFDAIDDPYLRSRREDVDHVIGRVQARWCATRRRPSARSPRASARILVSDIVAPAELAHLERSTACSASITTGGSPLSHSAILARSMRLPMVVGAHDALKRITDDDLILHRRQARRGVVHPTAQDLARYRTYQREQRAAPTHCRAFAARAR